MLKPHPTVLRRLVEEYETLASAAIVSGPQAPDRRLDDVAYTLCVSTGTRDVEVALATAHRWLTAATPTVIPVPAGPGVRLQPSGNHRWDAPAPTGAPAPA
ncbi:DUF5133 domain-containing protein [Streptomyces sp. G35A]